MGCGKVTKHWSQPKQRRCDKCNDGSTRRHALVASQSTLKSDDDDKPNPSNS